MTSTGVACAVSAEGISEPVTTTGLSFVGTLVSCPSAVVATITEPTKLSSDGMRRVVFSCRLLIIVRVRLSVLWQRLGTTLLVFPPGDARKICNLDFTISRKGCAFEELASSYHLSEWLTQAWPGGHTQPD